jgi:hypothetical protein
MMGRASIISHGSIVVRFGPYRTHNGQKVVNSHVCACATASREQRPFGFSNQLENRFSHDYAVASHHGNVWQDKQLLS